MRIPDDRILGGEGRRLRAGAQDAQRRPHHHRGARYRHRPAALDDALRYAEDREQFDQPIGDFQAIQHKLADMDTKAQAARLLMHKAADLKMRDETFIKEAAQAKLYASEISREVANEGIQIHGGYGYTKDFAAERYYRDAKLNEIYEGTSEILRNTIGDWLQK